MTVATALTGEELADAYPHACATSAVLVLVCCGRFHVDTIQLGCSRRHQQVQLLVRHDWGLSVERLAQTAELLDPSLELRAVRILTGTTDDVGTEEQAMRPDTFQRQPHPAAETR